MTVRRTMTMNWDDLAAPDADDNDDHFFDSSDRASVSFAFPIDNGNLSSSDDDEFEDGRMSFASTVSSAGSDDFRSSFRGGGAGAPMIGDYDLWTAEPGSIKERRQRLLQGMGLSGDKEHSNAAINGLPRAVSNKMKNSSKVSPMETDSSPPNKESKQEPEPSPSPSPMTSPILLVRSRSENDIGSFCMEKERRKQIIGEIPKQRLTRTFSTSSPCARLCCLNGNSIQISRKEDGGDYSMRGGGLGLNSRLSSSGFGAFFLIKNLDTGNEFIVNEYDQHGMWNRLSDLQTGKQLTMEEFEKSVGYSPVVKELMRRENISRNPGDGGGERKATAANSYLSKSVRYSKRRGVALLKNIKGVANTMSGLIITDKEREHNNSSMEQKTSKNNGSPSSKWTKVRQHGKSLKELTALHLCQEIQAHEGSIWTIRFSLDAKYLASAGEDRLIHVWEVQECELMSMGSTDDYCCTLSGQCTPQQPNACSSSDRPNLAEVAALMEKEKKKKGKNSSGSKKGNSIPDYVYSPETVFSLSEKPACTFKGHLDDVLDLSWSKSQLLLSSSMDKTVRLWDMETQTCLKLFAHNDYVTCIQFNPVDDNHFISGSLDAKVRIWSIDGRQVIDWSDLHEMVTAACFTPDGQGALIGSHRGNCRLYSITDGKLSPMTQFDIQNKKKSQAKKITGLQFAPGNNSSEVLITSADSRIRIYDGSDMIYKFRGFRNTSSQISASFSPDGKYIVCASEDSHVYIWKRPEDPKNGSSVTGKNKGFINTRSHELFQCREVSVAVPWPGTIKGDPPPPPQPPVHSKRHSKRSSVGPPPPQQTDSPTTADDGIANGKRGNLPPLPKKNAAAPEEEISGRVDSGIGAGGESFNSSPASGRFGDSISESGNLSSWSGSWSVYDGGNSHRSPGTAAWGMVIVTAGLGGEIRAYQNFGLPVRIGRQNNLFNAT